MAADADEPRPDVLRALRAALLRLPGGRSPHLQRDVGELSAEGARSLLGVIRHLQAAADSERQKRRRGQFW
ncbi:MAG TPA: hypothetical protein DEA08_33260 [Planctomycetes bacterium]|nr:hypothetical protein [Planctomycetota bacterium]